MLELFVSETCPYCRKVLDYFNEHNIKYKKVDVKIPNNLERLVELGGMAQVPFLYDKDKALRMYESDDIIKYAGENV